MASEPFFYQSVLLDARRSYTEFYCIPTDRTAFGIRTWPRLVLHVGLCIRLVFFGGDGVRSAIRTLNLAMPRLAWLVFCWRRPFVLFNEDAFLRVRSRSKKKKKKKPILADLFRPVGGVRPNPPEPPIATPLPQLAAFVLFHFPRRERELPIRDKIPCHVKEFCLHRWSFQVSTPSWNATSEAS